MFQFLPGRVDLVALWKCSTTCMMARKQRWVKCYLCRCFRISWRSCSHHSAPKYWCSRQSKQKPAITLWGWSEEREYFCCLQSLFPSARFSSTYCLLCNLVACRWVSFCRVVNEPWQPLQEIRPCMMATEISRKPTRVQYEQFRFAH